MYPEYTGTGLLVILKPSKSDLAALVGSREKVFNYVQEGFDQQYDLQWLKPIGFNNAYALMMRKEQAQSLNIRTITDLTEYVSTDNHRN